jgi:hypothetical protein
MVMNMTWPGVRDILSQEMLFSGCTFFLDLFGHTPADGQPEAGDRASFYQGIPLGIVAQPDLHTKQSLMTDPARVRKPGAWGALARCF